MGMFADQVLTMLRDQWNEDREYCGQTHTDDEFLSWVASETAMYRESAWWSTDPTTHMPSAPYVNPGPNASTCLYCGRVTYFWTLLVQGDRASEMQVSRVCPMCKEVQ
jgi:hypothetical protein